MFYLFNNAGSGNTGNRLITFRNGRQVWRLEQWAPAPAHISFPCHSERPPCHSEWLLVILSVLPCHSERQRRICCFQPYACPRSFTPFRMTGRSCGPRSFTPPAAPFRMTERNFVRQCHCNVTEAEMCAERMSLIAYNQDRLRRCQRKSRDVGRGSAMEGVERGFLAHLSGEKPRCGQVKCHGRHRTRVPCADVGEKADMCARKLSWRA